MNHQKIRDEIYRDESSYIDWRRHFHEHPELSMQETETSNYIGGLLDEMGIRWEKAGKHSLIGQLGDPRSPGIVLRADMDALPIQEAGCNLCREKNCISANAGISHACGHDAHMAMLLGALRYFSRHSELLQNRRIVFVFEEAEETGEGIGAVMEALQKYRPSGFFGIHVYNTMPTGTICIDDGARMAGQYCLDIKFIGTEGHGARPDLAKSPIFAAADFLTSLTTAFQNQIPPGEVATLGFGTIHGGTLRNIIPKEVLLTGTTRYFKPEIIEIAARVIERTARSTAEIHGIDVVFGAEHGPKMDPCINEPIFSKNMREALEQAVPGAVVSVDPWYASESMSEYLNAFGGAMAHLGIASDEVGSGSGHHTPEFDVDESALKLGVLSYVLAGLH